MELLKKFWRDQIFINIFSGIMLMILGYIFVSNDKVKKEIHEFIYPIVAPELVIYNKSFSESLIKETEAGMCPTHVELAKDYLRMRDQHRFITNPENWK